MTSLECFWLLLALLAFVIGARHIAASIDKSASAMSDIAGAIRELNSRDEEQNGH